MVKNRYYFIAGNTAKGFVNFLHSNIEEIDQIITLNHPSNIFKTAILQKLINNFVENYNLEIIYSSSGIDFLEGIIIRDKSLAIITDHIKPDNIHAKDIFISHEQMQDNSFNEYQEEAYQHFSTALTIHDDLENIYINEMDFSKADQAAENFIQKLLRNVPKKKNRTPHIYRRLFGATTADGPINIVPHIIKDLSHRVYIKGRAGTGKSVFMKKVATACESHGFNLELYHCSFDPDSIDMVLVPELNFCIFDSTDPHEYAPERDSDFIIDLYKETVTPGVDERFANKIEEVTQQYKSFVKKGVNSLRKAQLSQNKIEKKYEIVDQAEIQKVTENVMKHIM